MSSGHPKRRRARIAAASCLTSAAAAFAGGGWLASHAAAAQSVSITNGGCSGGGSLYCYGPEAVSVPVGTAVTWSNQSGVGHTATACTASVCSGAPASTGSNTFAVSIGAANGSSGAFTFTSPGTYTYYCSIHGYAAMHATITVTAATGGPTPTPTPSSSAQGVATTPGAPGTGASLGAGWGFIGLFIAGAGVVATLLALTNRQRRD